MNSVCTNPECQRLHLRYSRNSCFGCGSQVVAVNIFADGRHELIPPHANPAAAPIPPLTQLAVMPINDVPVLDHQLGAWCLYCHDIGHYKRQCPHDGREPPAKRRSPTYSPWERYRKDSDVENMAIFVPGPSTFDQAFALFDIIYQHALDFDIFVKARDDDLLEVQDYLARYLDEELMEAWIKSMDACNCHTDAFLSAVRELTMEFFEKGIFEPVTEIMDKDPTAYKMGPLGAVFKDRGWTRLDVAAYVNGLGNDDRNDYFDDINFLTYAGGMRRESANWRIIDITIWLISNNLPHVSSTTRSYYLQG